MQTIDDTLLTASFGDEDGRLLQLEKAKQKYLTQPASVQLLVKGQDLLAQPNWTIVDKGDARLSLMAIDNDYSHQLLNEHFELLVTYSLLANQLQVKFKLTNNSQQAFACQLAFVCPENQQLTLASSDFTQADSGQLLTAPLTVGAQPQTVNLALVAD